MDEPNDPPIRYQIPPDLTKDDPLWHTLRAVAVQAIASSMYLRNEHPQLAAKYDQEARRLVRGLNAAKPQTGGGEGIRRYREMTVDAVDVIVRDLRITCKRVDALTDDATDIPSYLCELWMNHGVTIADVIANSSGLSHVLMGHCLRLLWTTAVSMSIGDPVPHPMMHVQIEDMNVDIDADEQPPDYDYGDDATDTTHNNVLGELSAGDVDSAAVVDYFAPLSMGHPKVILLARTWNALSEPERCVVVSRWRGDRTPGRAEMITNFGDPRPDVPETTDTEQLTMTQ